jgi:type I restriction enzyme S subunit
VNSTQQTYPLSYCISLYGGGTPSKDTPEYWDGEIPWASVKDLKTTSLNTTQDSITALGLANSSSKIVKAGSIIIATRMAVGRVAITELDVAINQDLKAFVCSDKVDVKYLFYFLFSQENNFNKVASGATVKGIKINHIMDMRIPLPPLAEQKKIAAILDAADSLRQKDRQLIDHYTALSQSLFLEMFGDPVTNPMEWEIKAIEKILDRKSQNGLYLTQDKYKSTGIEMVHMSDAFYGIVSPGNLKKVTLTDQELEKYKLSTNDLLLARRSLTYEGAAKPCLIPEYSKNLVYESSLIRITPKKELANSLYLYFFFSNKGARNKFVNKYISRSTISGINNKGLNSIKIPLPPITLQNQFAKRIQLIEQQKQQAQASLEKSEALFNSLLQCAFNGELTQPLAA